MERRARGPVRLISARRAFLIKRKSGSSSSRPHEWRAARERERERKERESEREERESERDGKGAHSQRLVRQIVHGREREMDGARPRERERERERESEFPNDVDEVEGV